MVRVFVICFFGVCVFVFWYGYFLLDWNLKCYFFCVINFCCDWYLLLIWIKVECGCYSGWFYLNWDVEVGIWNLVLCYVDVNYVMGILMCCIFIGVFVVKDEGFRVYFWFWFLFWIFRNFFIVIGGEVLSWNWRSLSIFVL